MYSIRWARERVNEHRSSHTRATEFLDGVFPNMTVRLPIYLAGGHVEWECWKYLVRMIENAWGIRAKPNTTEHLNSIRASSVLEIVLVKSFLGNPKYLLTGLETYATLYEQSRVREPDTLSEVSETLVPDEGQFELF